MVGLPVRIDGYAPSSTSAWQISGDPLGVNRVLNFPAELSLDITADWERYADEDDTANPAQDGAYWEVWRGEVCEWRGKIESVAREVVAGRPRVMVRGLDKLHVLNHTLALGPSGEKVWSRETPSLAKSNTTYLAGYYSSFGDNRNFVWWPTPDDATSGLWVSEAASPSTTLGAAITNAPSPADGGRIKLAATFPGFIGPGFMSFNSGGEWVEFSAIQEDPADGFFYAVGVRRAALGTTMAANVAQGSTVYFRLAKRINPRARVLVEGNAGGTWELLPTNNHCKPNHETGSLKFPTDPLTLRADAGGYSAIRATLEIFDEEDNGLSLGTVLEDMLQTDPADGGTGFGSGGAVDSCGVNVDAALRDIKLTRVVVKEATLCMEVIKGLLAEIGLARGTVEDSVVFYYDADADEVVFKYVGQLASSAANRTYYGEASLREEANSEQAKTAVCVEYDELAGFNLVATRTFWHTQVFETDSGGGAGPPWIYQKFAGTWDTVVITFPTSCNATMEGMSASGPPQTSNLLTDNEANSGIAILWDALQAAGTHFYGWFPGTTTTAPATLNVTKIVASLGLWGDAAGASGGQAYFGVEVRGFESFTGSLNTTPPTASDEVPISAKLAADAVGSFREETELRLEADGLLVPLKAIGLKFHGYMDMGTTSMIAAGQGQYGFILNELYVEGFQKQQALVVLSATYDAADNSRLVAPETAAKHIDVHMGQHDIEIVRIGAAQQGTALSFGWLLLLQSISSAQAREYVISSDALRREGIAQVSETVNLSQAPGTAGYFTGVASEVSWVVSGGVEGLSLRVVDYLDPVTGTIGCARVPLPSDPDLRDSEELRLVSAVQKRFVTLEAAR